MKSDMDFFFF